MSLGSPSQLGTLLIQRLDTLFGLTQSQQTNLSSGARPDAVIPTERGQPTHSLQNPGAKPLPKTRSSSEKAVATRQAVEKAQTTQKAISQTDTLSSIQTRLGTTAQFILKLLQTYPHADPIRAQQPLLNTQEHQNQIQTPQSRTTKKPIQPLLPLTKHLQQNLKKTVQQSGLFYEAQLARHLEGKLANKQQLLAQPQNQTKAHTQNSPQPIAQNVASTHHTIPEQLYPVIRQQLELLATEQWQWLGELWPGASLYWQIQQPNENSHFKSQKNNQQKQVWRSRIKINLPRMGNLYVQISWSENKLSVCGEAEKHAIQQLKPFINILKSTLAHLAKVVIVEFQPINKDESHDGQQISK